jgi:hypothetical protein
MKSWFMTLRPMLAAIPCAEPTRSQTDVVTKRTPLAAGAVVDETTFSIVADEAGAGLSRLRMRRRSQI